MALRHRRIAAIVLALTATSGLTGCVAYEHTPSATIVVRKEYIPATQRAQAECSGGVPMMCSEQQVLEKQCWRLDLEVRYAVRPDSAERAREQGEPAYQAVAEQRCVLPSELAAARVGDPFVEPTVKY